LLTVEVPVSIYRDVEVVHVVRIIGEVHKDEVDRIIEWIGGKTWDIIGIKEIVWIISLNIKRRFIIISSRSNTLSQVGQPKVSLVVGIVIVVEIDSSRDIKVDIKSCAAKAIKDFNPTNAAIGVLFDTFIFIYVEPRTSVNDRVSESVYS
jgi:hypothetical protein